MDFRGSTKCFETFRTIFSSKGKGRLIIISSPVLQFYATILSKHFLHSSKGKRRLIIISSPVLQFYIQFFQNTFYIPFFKYSFFNEYYYDIEDKEEYIDSRLFNLEMELLRKFNLEIRPKFSKSFIPKLYSSPSFINFPIPLRLRNDVVDHDLCWFSKRYKKKPIFFSKK